MNKEHPIKEQPAEPRCPQKDYAEFKERYSDKLRGMNEDDKEYIFNMLLLHTDDIDDAIELWKQMKHN